MKILGSVSNVGPSTCLDRPEDKRCHSRCWCWNVTPQSASDSCRENAADFPTHRLSATSARLFQDTEMRPSERCPSLPTSTDFQMRVSLNLSTPSEKSVGRRRCQAFQSLLSDTISDPAKRVCSSHPDCCICILLTARAAALHAKYGMFTHTSTQEEVGGHRRSAVAASKFLAVELNIFSREIKWNKVFLLSYFFLSARLPRSLLLCDRKQHVSQPPSFDK